MDTTLKERVAQLLGDLEGPYAESVVCALTELPGALPILADAYHSETDHRRRQMVVHILWQFRDLAALPTLAVALSDPDDRVWKEALDGIVTLGGPSALRVLLEARAALSEAQVRRGWIDEAIDQVQEGSAPG